MSVLAINEFARNSDGFNLKAGVAADSGGDVFANTGQELVVIDNQSGAPITVTFVTPAIVDDLNVPDKTMVVPAAGIRVIGPFPNAWYTNSIGLLSINYSSATSVFVLILRPTGLRPLL